MAPRRSSRSFTAFALVACLAWMLFCALVPCGKNGLSVLSFGLWRYTQAREFGWPVPATRCELEQEEGGPARVVRWRLSAPALLADLVAGLVLGGLTVRLLQVRARERYRLVEAAWIGLLLLNLSFPLWLAAGRPVSPLAFVRPGRAYLGTLLLVALLLAHLRHVLDRETAPNVAGVQA